MDEAHGERLERLKADVESAKRALHDALEFISDDRHLTPKGRRERDDLLREIEEIEQNLEAIRQEHRPG